MRIIILILILALTGCATKSYVNDMCDKTLSAANEHSSKSAINALRYTSDVEDKLDRMRKDISRSSEIRRSINQGRYIEQLDELQLKIDALRKEMEVDE